MKGKVDLEQEARLNAVRAVRTSTCRGAGGPEPSKGQSVGTPTGLSWVKFCPTTQPAAHNTWLGGKSR